MLTVVSNGGRRELAAARSTTILIKRTSGASHTNVRISAHLSRAASSEAISVAAGPGGRRTTATLPSVRHLPLVGARSSASPKRRGLGGGDQRPDAAAESGAEAARRQTRRCSRASVASRIVSGIWLPSSSSASRCESAASSPTVARSASRKAAAASGARAVSRDEVVAAAGADPRPRTRRRPWARASESQIARRRPARDASASASDAPAPRRAGSRSRAARARRSAARL